MSQQAEPCICNTGPGTDGPDETCPQHGRPYSYWVEACGVLGQRLDSGSLLKDIEHAINRYSAENGSDTPDFILAEYLTDCLAAFDRAVTARTKWGSVPTPSMGRESTE